MSFHEVQFPPAISLGARGGPSRRTQIVTLAGGAEQRNADWFASRHKYDVGYGIKSAADLHAVKAFFEARAGRAYGFRFRDWADYRSGVPTAAPAATDQVIGTGDGTRTAFQLVKAYASGAQSYVRTIAKPVAGTVLVAVAGVPQASGWTVNAATGVVTFTTAPANGAAVTAGFEFDVPVRFDSDEFLSELAFAEVGSIPSIPLIEVRL